MQSVKLSLSVASLISNSACRDDALWIRSEEVGSATVLSSIVCGCSLSTWKKVAICGGSDRVSESFLATYHTISIKVARNPATSVLRAKKLATGSGRDSTTAIVARLSSKELHGLSAEPVFSLGLAPTQV